MPERLLALGAGKGKVAPPNTDGTETAGVLKATLTQAGLPATAAAGAELDTAGAMEAAAAGAVQTTDALGAPADAWRRAPTIEREYCPSGP